jgi:hypothetical protein
MCTLYYGDDQLAMSVDNVHRINRLTIERIVNEAALWGMQRDRATAIINDLLEMAPDAIAAARDETEEVPKQLISMVLDQWKQLRSAGDQEPRKRGDR